MKILLLLICLSLYAEEPHHTTAFVKSCENLISFSRYSTDHFWNKKGKKLPTFNHFKQNSYLLYSEYALSDCNSMFLNGGYSTVSESMNGTSQAVNDVQIGWKHLFNGSEIYAFSLELTTLVPFGKKKSSIRYGKWGIQMGLLYSFLLSDDFWIDTGIGYRFYEGYPSDQLRIFLSIGCQWPSFVIITTLESHCGLYNGDANGNRNNIVFNSNYRLFKAKIEGIINLMKHLSLTIGAFQHIWGQNCGAGGGYFCGTWLVF